MVKWVEPLVWSPKLNWWVFATVTGFGVDVVMSSFARQSRILGIPSFSQRFRRLRLGEVGEEKEEEKEDEGGWE